MRALNRPTLSLLSRLWLNEPDAEALSQARDAGLSAADDPQALAAAWTDLFLLNVYPYGTAFTDVSAELNGPAAAAAARRYAAAGFRPPELARAGAPDHAGLCLGFLAHLAAGGHDDPEFLSWTLDWLPVCALAVERQPQAHPFYRDLAAATREVLLGGPSAPAGVPGDFEPVLDTGAEPDDELDLSRVVRFFLAPAACGLFLSRSRLGGLALEAGLRLPFGSRFDVARALFEAAGEWGRVGAVLDALSAEVQAWDAAYAALARDHASWQTRSGTWRRRLAVTTERLAEMRQSLESPLASTYERKSGG